MNPIRVGNFTSSDIHKLQSVSKDKKDFGAPAKTYIKEKRRERKLGVEIDLDSSSYPTSWGKAMEGYVFTNHIETEYSMQSDQTITHPDKKFCGTPDFTSSDTVCDLKCPFTRNSFCDMVDFIESESIEFFKECKPEYYWQLVSNSILTKKPFAELIIWMPYLSELPKIISYIENIDDYDIQKDIQWVVHADFKRVPHIPNNSQYKNIYRFRFEVPKSEKDLLTKNINKAYELLTT